MYEKFEKELNNCLINICHDIQRSYPLTLIQKLKLAYISYEFNKVTINSNNSESFVSIEISEEIIKKKSRSYCLGVKEYSAAVKDYCLSIIVKKIFELIIDLRGCSLKDSLVEYEFSEFVKASMVEFYTFKYCIKNDIEYDSFPYYGRILYLDKLISGFPPDFFTDKEIEDTLFRISINDFLNLSSNGPMLLNDFKELFNSKKYTKKEMN